jgi:hypothetical protein
VEHSNIIELNGKRYDAITGEYLGKSRAKPVPAKAPQGRVIDGVVRRSSKVAAPSPVPAAAKAVPHIPAHPAKKTKRHHKPHHARAHQPERAKTLMRHAVKKPQASLKPAIKPQSPAEVAAAPASSLATKKSVAQIDPVRMQRASQTRRHQHVQRFAAPAARTAPHRAPAPVHRAQPKPQHAQAHHAAAPAPQTHARPVDIFEAAIARATSHEQPIPRVARQQHRRKRMWRATAGIAVLLIIGGFVAWTQRAHIELRVASFQAGFQASMPSHQLLGYERGDIRNEHGQIVINYRSGDSHYTLTQRPSEWNSQTLLDSAVAGASTSEPKIVESKGRVVYVYGNNASWVDGGIRYDITGNAPLTPDDIRAIVDSL